MLKAEARAIHDMGTAARKIAGALLRHRDTPTGWICPDRGAVTYGMLEDALTQAVREAVEAAKALKALEGPDAE